MSAEHLLSDEYKNKYEGYYRQDLTRKRQIAAADAFSHICNLVGTSVPGKVIDVGAGEGSLLTCMCKQNFANQLYAVEISGSGLDAIRARGLETLVDARLFDGYRIPYPDKYFDLAISSHVLEHVEHERLLLRELKRVARHVFLEVPLENGFSIEKAIKVGNPFGHINFYTPETFLNLLNTSGLKPLLSKVTVSSLAYEQFVSGKIKGAIKHYLRRGGLAAAPKLAPWFFGSLMTVYCET